MDLSKKSLTYETAKEIFYKSDFFNWQKDDGLNIFKDEEGELLEYAKENFFNEFSFIYENNYIEVNPMKFLHGYCDEFAIALAKEMNYRVGVIYEVDEASGKFTHLIHAYCVKDDDVNNIYHIDVRGICPDYTQIVSEPEFEYSYDYSVYDEMDVEEAISFFEINMNDCRKSGHYNSLNIEAKNIINMFKDKFVV